MDTAGFTRRVIGGVPHYRCGALEDLSFLRHGFSTRLGGVSPLPASALNLTCVPWDSRDNVDENRRRFMAALSVRAGRLRTLRQIHSNRLHIIRDNADEWNPRLEGDALATGCEGVVLAVQVADCFPVLMADPDSRSVAAVHAGWRGILAGILSRTIGSIAEAFGSDPARLLIAVGPGIRSCCMEVGPEVGELFSRAFPNAAVWIPHPSGSDKRMLDLRAAMDLEFAGAGVAPEHIFDLQACTRCRADEFFSYRAEGPRSGRMMGLITLTRPRRRGLHRR
jgi:YfiH family protein